VICPLGCRTIKFDVPDQINLPEGQLGAILRATESLEGVVTGTLDSSAIEFNSPRGLVRIEAVSGTTLTASFQIPPGTLANDAVHLGNIQGKLTFSTPIKVFLGESSVIDASEIAIAEGRGEAEVEVARTLLSLIVARLSCSERIESTGVIGEFFCKQFVMNLKPGGLLEGPQNGKLNIGFGSQFVLRDASYKLDGKKRWGFTGAVDIALNLPARSQWLNDSASVEADASQVKLTMNIQRHADGRMLLKAGALSGDQNISFTGLHFKRGDRATSVTVGRASLVPTSLELESSSDGKWVTSAFGTLRVSEEIAFSHQRTRLIARGLDESEMELNLRDSESSDSLFVVRSKAPLHARSVDFETAAPSGSQQYVLGLRDITIPQFEISSPDAGSTTIGEGTSFKVAYYRNLQANDQIEFTADAELELSDTWRISLGNDATGIAIPSGRLTVRNGQIVDRRLKTGDVIMLDNVQLDAAIDSTGIITSGTLKAATTGNIVISGLGSALVDAEIGSLEFRKINSSVVLAFKGLILAFTTDTLPALLNGKIIPIEADKIKFGDGGDLSPLRNARNTGGSITVTDTPSISGLLAFTIPAKIVLPFKFDASHWVFLKKSWRPSNGTVTIAGKFSSLFNKVDYVAGDGNPGLGAGTLKLNFGWIRIGDAKLGVDSPSRGFQQTVGIAASFLFGVTGGNLPGSWLGEVKLPMKDVKGLSAIALSLKPQNVRVTSAMVKSRPAILLSMDGELTLD